MEWISSELIHELKVVLKQDVPIAILTHVNPDGDAIGSSLALMHYLQGKGKKVTVLVPNESPGFLKWMPGHSEIIYYGRNKEKADTVLASAGIMFYLDFNDPKRLSRMQKSVEANNKAIRILVDHHPYPQVNSSFVISETRVSSTAELIYYLARDLEGAVPDGTAFARCIYAGIMTDTGCFSFNSSLPSTWEVVGSLLRKGIDKDEIFDRVYNNFSFNRMRLAGYALDQKMKILPEMKAAYISLTREEMKRYKFKVGDSEGFVNYPLSIKGIRLSALFLEKKDHVKISFRSKGNFPVNDLASKYFSGGGHKNAAGGESPDSLEATLAKFEEVLKSYSKWMK